MQTGTMPGWKIAGPVAAGLVLLVLLFYRETSLYVMGIWNWQDGETYTHGYLALAISLYLVYRQRTVLASLTPCPSVIALFAVAASGLLWLVALLGGVITIQIAALLLLIISVTWATVGSQVTLRLLFPLLIISFAIPIWDPLPPVLQEMTTDAVFGVIRLLDVPALREGHLIILPAGRLAINESCSGISYLLAALTLGMLYAYLNYQGFWSRLLIVMVSGIAAILANMVRVFIVVYLAYKTDMQHPLVADHYNLGWYLFGGLVFILLIIDTRVHHHAGESGTGTRPQGKIAAAKPCNRGAMQSLPLFAATVILIVAGPVMAWLLEKQIDYPQESVLKLPSGAGGWSGPSITQDRWSPVYHGAIAGKRVYRKDGQEIYLYIGHYPVQTQGKELINSLNRISNPDVWRTQYPSGQVNRIGNRTVLEQVLKSSTGQQRLVWYWYRVAGRQTTNEYEAKLLQISGILTGSPQASVIAIAANIGNDPGDARKILGDFISAMEQSLAPVIEGNI